MNFGKICIFPIISFFIFLLLTCTVNNTAGKKSSLLIGIAQVNYTPEVGLDLVGNYRGNDYASRGIHDSLYARAMVASNLKGEKVALLTIDICSLTREPVDFMRAFIASKTDIKPENVMIHATHTHSGPKSDLNAPKAKEYLTKAAGAVVLANQQLKPAVFAVGYARESRVSHNRRLKCIDGTTLYDIGAGEKLAESGIKQLKKIYNQEPVKKEAVAVVISNR